MVEGAERTKISYLRGLGISLVVLVHLGVCNRPYFIQFKVSFIFGFTWHICMYGLVSSSIFNLSRFAEVTYVRAVEYDCNLSSIVNPPIPKNLLHVILSFATCAIKKRFFARLIRCFSFITSQPRSF